MANNMDSALVAVFKQRFPKEYEIAYLTLRNQLMQSRLEEMAKENPPPKARKK